MDAVVLTVAKLSQLDADEIVSKLTRKGSEFQAEVRDREQNKSATPVAVVRSHEARIAAWATSHIWEGLQTLECFTRDDLRRRGLARVAASLLVASGVINPRECVAVFEPMCVSLARSVGCREVRLFELSGGDWVEVA